MATFSSRQTKKYSFLVDWLFVLFALTLILLIVVPADVNIYSSVRTAPKVQESLHPDISTGGPVSFAADQQYWDASCSHGWSSDVRCDAIVSRTHSCAVSVDSVYCSEYEKDLQE